VRRAIRQVDRIAGRDAARLALGVPGDRFLVAVMGGSQGSGALNSAIGEFAAAHRDDAGLALYHVVGERFEASVATAGVAPAGVVHRVVGYEPHMEIVYAASDVLVARGGASTVAEVAVTGTPAILVPWSGAAEDHQTANAGWLADQGAAVLLDETRLAELGAVVERLRHDPAQREALARNAERAGERNRSGAVGALIERVALPDPGPERH
jgi:UDP-N-acetylglucosamine--N-acetylmuramyl-(pentapeptide) pyrophosphoryl-undecaprenol N-acetylglucosamine transferase